MNMGEEIKPFKGSVGEHYPIEGINNPTTEIKYEAGPRDNNIGKVANKKGKTVLPKVTVQEIKSN